MTIQHSVDFKNSGRIKYHPEGYNTKTIQILFKQFTSG